MLTDDVVEEQVHENPDLDEEDDPNLTIRPANDDVSDDEAGPSVVQVQINGQVTTAVLDRATNKFKWVDAATRTFTPRVEWTASDFPTLAPHLDHLTASSPPHEFFMAVDAPDAEYELRARNSEVYRYWRAIYDMDGPGAVRVYDGAAKIEYADMRYMDAAVLLHGLDPAVSRAKMFCVDTLAVKGHRVGDLFTEKRYKVLRKFHHPGDVRRPCAQRGKPGYDNLHQLTPMLESFLKTSREAVVAGKRKSTDEETIGFQGASASLKQNCGKYKQAGDGLQADTICLEGGWLQACCFRGHTLGPTVQIKGSQKKLCPLHQR